MHGVGEGAAGNSPLQLAILKSDKQMAELIVRYCGQDDINHRNFKGETALHQATINGLGEYIFLTGPWQANKENKFIQGCAANPDDENRRKTVRIS